MTNLMVRSEVYPSHRELQCGICSCNFEAFFVGVVLFWDETPLGNVCPRCLHRHPTRGVWPILSGKSPASVAAGSMGPWVAGELAAADEWPFTVEELMAAERAIIRSRYRLLSEESIRLLVDDRFKKMLSENTEPELEGEALIGASQLP